MQDPAKPVKARLAANPVAGFSKVISLTKLKKKYGQFQEKRELCASYDAFFADERILPSLSKVLGKVRPWHLCCSRVRHSVAIYGQQRMCMRSKAWLAAAPGRLAHALVTKQ